MNRLFELIIHICIYSLLAVQRVMISDRNSFELYGYDILIDNDLKPWLIEVNASPSLTANTQADYTMKLALLHDTITIVDMEQKLNLDNINNTNNSAGATASNNNNNNNSDNFDFTNIGGFDLIYKNNNFIKQDNSAVYTSQLGFANQREKTLRKMFKYLRKQNNQTSKENSNQNNNNVTSNSINNNTTSSITSPTN